ncbi:MAG TPA: primosomal protein [Mycobacterium sp.]|nr:primosomal protein [Mycobacterium sp.]
MAADLIPIRLALTSGDRYTLWAPRWRDAGDEWEAFLGKDDDLYGFETTADLVAFVRTDTDNDLTDHPGWQKLTQAGAHRLDPAKANRFDLVGVEELLADKPTKKAIRVLTDTLTVVASIGSVCELPAVMRFFNGNPNLGTLGGGVDAFTGRGGRKRWNTIAEVIGRNWDDILAAIAEIMVTPDVDSATSARAADELAQEPPEEEEVPADEVESAAASADDEADDAADDAAGDEAEADDDAEGASAGPATLGGDEDFWTRVGIDPIRIMTGTGTFYTLRCYLDDRPVFLGRNGRISVFGSERALARYLADEHDHDLSDLATYDDIRTAATDGSLAIDITDENVYVLTGLADDFADGPDAVDREQLELAVELLRDVGDYSEENVVETTLAPDRPLGQLVGYVLDSDSVDKPRAPFAAAIKEWESLERFVESRLRRE